MRRRPSESPAGWAPPARRRLPRQPIARCGVRPHTPDGLNARVRPHTPAPWGYPHWGRPRRGHRPPTTTRTPAHRRPAHQPIARCGVRPHTPDGLNTRVRPHTPAPWGYPLRGRLRRGHRPPTTTRTPAHRRSAHQPITRCGVRPHTPDGLNTRVRPHTPAPWGCPRWGRARRGGPGAGPRPQPAPCGIPRTVGPLANRSHRAGSPVPKPRTGWTCGSDRTPQPRPTCADEPKTQPRGSSPSGGERGAGARGPAPGRSPHRAEFRRPSAPASTDRTVRGRGRWWGPPRTPHHRAAGRDLGVTTVSIPADGPPGGFVRTRRHAA